LQSGTVAELVAVMRSRVQIPHRDGDGPFLFAIDHCFPIKGQGTVMTGTVLSGSCKLNDVVELPDLRQEKKVKSMQMFKKAVSRIREGDRAGICVAGLDASLVERGLACTPGTGVYCWFLYSITLHSNILACSGSSTRCYSAGSESKVFQRCWGF
jgi:selenocysteine-specific elongation factor